MGSRPYKSAVIANGQTVSGRVNLVGLRPAAILFPAAFTGATISFRLPDTAGGWAALNSVTITPVVSQWVALTEAQAFVLGDDFQIVSAGAEAAERTLWVTTR